jgi:hypothetical protein
MSGIAAIGDRANAAGVAAGNGKLILWRRDKGVHKIITETKAPELQSVHLKLTASHGSTFQFAFSPDGKQWTTLGDAQPGDKFPPWDRSIRVGLTAGGAEKAVGLFRDFAVVDTQ